MNIQSDNFKHNKWSSIIYLTPKINTPFRKMSSLFILFRIFFDILSILKLSLNERCTRRSNATKGNGHLIFDKS